MCHGVALPGTLGLDESRWRNDALYECHWDDHLWGYTCHMAKALHVRDLQSFVDPVLHQLFVMGTFDWSGKNCCEAASTQAMCHSTVIGSRLFQMIQDLTVLRLNHVAPQNIKTSTHNKENQHQVIPFSPYAYHLANL